MTNLVNLTDKFPLTNKTIKVGKVPVEIKTYISAEDFMSAVRLVVEASFDEDGAYRPEYKELVKRYAYLRYLTDIDVSDIETGELYKVTQSEWYEQIAKEFVNIQAYYNINDAIDEAIQYRLDTRQTAFDKLCNDLSAILNTNITDNLADVKDVLDKLNSVDKKEFVKAVTENVIEKEST